MPWLKSLKRNNFFNSTRWNSFLFAARTIERLVIGQISSSTPPAGNEWVGSNRTLCYAQTVLGSPGGKHCKSLEGNVQFEGSVKLFFFGQKIRFWKWITLFWPLFYQKWSWAKLIRGSVRFCLNDVIKSIDKLCCLRNLESLRWYLHRVMVSK